MNQIDDGTYNCDMVKTERKRKGENSAYGEKLNIDLFDEKKERILRPIVRLQENWSQNHWL